MLSSSPEAGPLLTSKAREKSFASCYHAYQVRLHRRSAGKFKHVTRFPVLKKKYLQESRERPQRYSNVVEAALSFPSRETGNCFPLRFEER